MITDSVSDRDIRWTDDFLIGIDQLDFEHQSLIQDVNKLHQELVTHADTALVNSTLGSLHARLQAHFALEETFMLDKLYTDYPRHKDEHDRLLSEYTEMMINFEHDPTPSNREAMENTLRTWLVDHILGTDKKMSAMVGPNA